MEQQGEERIEESITLEMKSINRALQKNKSYTNDGIIFKYDLKQGEELTDLQNEHKYVTSISNGKFSYIGALNDKIERNLVGRNQYSNGDIYLGFWKNNKKDNYGIYLHKPEEGQVELYNGSWDGGLKSKAGIYIWKKGTDFEEPIAKATFDAYIGQFKAGKFSEGLFISQKVEDEKVLQHYYLGKFDDDGKKVDDNGFYYMAHIDKVFYGKINDDKLLEGHVAKLNEDGELDTPFYFKKDEEGNINSDDIEEDKKDEITQQFQKFLSLVKETDFFELINQQGKLCMDEVYYYDSLDKFESEEGFAKDLKKLTSYGDIYDKIKPIIKERQEREAASENSQS